MTHSTQSRPSSKGPNSLAVLISFAAVAILYVNFQETPAGETRAAKAASSFASVSIELPPPPPLPVSKLTQQPQAENEEPDSQTPKQTQPNEKPTVQAIPEGHHSGHVALLLNLLLLEKASARLEQVTHYTATFLKQERIDGELSERQVMQLKMRHSPFSVYLKWLEGGDVGRELLYVEGQNSNKMLVHVGGFKGRFLPSLKLDPNGSLAMAEARYPITKAGLLELVKLAVLYRQSDIKQKSGVRCHMIENHEFEERPCYCFTIEYDNADISKTYRKSITLIDRETLMPVVIKNFTWPDQVDADTTENTDEATLIEFYAFKDINMSEQLADIDFDRGNSKYRLRR